MQHRGSDPKHPGWTREYSYNEPSLLETGKVSNRLTSTTILGVDEIYSKDGDGYDAHGNMLKMPHLPLMVWDYRDQLQATSQQVVTNGGTPEITYYVYDASGQRTRKVTERQAGPNETPNIKEERLYLGGFEVFRRYSGNGQTVELERETLHIMDDKQRIALVETRTQGNDGSPEQLIRFQFGNHLGSAVLELDREAQTISYEEYFPYGSTSYQAVRKDIEVPAKRYRYTSMERDEESGLEYHSVRYYVPWLGKWISCDPAGAVNGTNICCYAVNNPVRFTDMNGRDVGDDIIDFLGVAGGASILPVVQKKLMPQPSPEQVRAAEEDDGSAKYRLKNMTWRDATRGEGVISTLYLVNQIAEMKILPGADGSVIAAKLAAKFAIGGVEGPFLSAHYAGREAAMSYEAGKKGDILGAMHHRNMAEFNAQMYFLQVVPIVPWGRFSPLVAGEARIAAGAEAKLASSTLGTSPLPPTGLARFDRLAVETKYYGQWKMNVEKRGFSVVEVSHPLGRAATLQGTTIEIDLTQFRYIDLLHESRHIAQVERAAARGVTNITTNSKLIGLAEKGAYEFEQRAGRSVGFSDEYMKWLESRASDYWTPSVRKHINRSPTFSSLWR